MIYLVEGNPSLDRVDAGSWAEAEAKLAGVGEVIGYVDDECKASGLACGLTELKFASEGDAMTFSGYGAVFNNVDRGGDKILPGAFTETLAEAKASGGLPSMFYQHGAGGGGPVMPVGKWTDMTEDSHGLRVEGKLFDHTLGRDLYVALKGGAIGGLSIGYRVKEFGRPAMGAAERRQLKSLALHEVSLVNDPMNGMARFTAVKSVEQIKTIRDYEDAIREVFGFSQARAKAIASHGFKSFDAGRDDGEGVKAIAEALRRNATLLKS